MNSKRRVFPTPDGKFIIDDSVRRGTGLLFVAESEVCPESFYPSENNLSFYKERGLSPVTVVVGGKKLVAYRGRFFTTKKGRKAFELREDGSHLLVCEGWECDRNYRPLLNPFIGRSLFHHMWESNGGGAGLLAAVFAADESFTLTEDEL